MDLFGGIFRNKDGVSVISGDFATFHSAHSSESATLISHRHNVVHVPMNVSDSSTLTPLAVDRKSVVSISVYRITLTKSEFSPFLDMTKVPLVGVSSNETYDVYFAVDSVTLTDNGKTVYLDIGISTANAEFESEVTKYTNTGDKRISGSYHLAFPTRTATVPYAKSDTLYEKPSLVFRLYFPMSSSATMQAVNGHGSGVGLEFYTQNERVGFTTRLVNANKVIPFAPVWLNDLRAPSPLAENNVWSTGTLGGQGYSGINARFAIYSSNRLTGVSTGSLHIYRHYERPNWFGSGGVDENRYISNTLLLRRLLLAPPIGGTDRVWYSDFPMYWSKSYNGSRSDSDGIGGITSSSSSSSASAAAGVQLKDNNAQFDVAVYIP
jgi:hypothetical protein